MNDSILLTNDKMFSGIEGLSVQALVLCDDTNRSL